MVSFLRYCAAVAWGSRQWPALGAFSVVLQLLACSNLSSGPSGADASSAGQATAPIDAQAGQSALVAGGDGVRQEASGTGGAPGAGASGAREADGGMSNGGAAGVGPSAGKPAAPVAAQGGRSGSGVAAGSGGQPSAGIGSHAGCTSADFCDDFESATGATPDATRWEIITPNCSGDADLQVDNTVAHSGMRSIRVRASAGYCNHVFVRAKGAVLPKTGVLYGRFFVRLRDALGANHVTFMALHDQRENKDLRLGGQSAVLIWNRESDDATLPELSPKGVAASAKPLPLTWLCIEFAIDTMSPTLHTWVDGEALPGLQAEGEATTDGDAQWQRKQNWQPLIQEARWGWESYADQANTLWFDDIALGSQRIGCEP